MLDAFIIDRLREDRERARRDGGRIPLYIEPPPAHPDARTPEGSPSRERPPEDDPGRGVVIVDFRL